jgi:hypothetical protein
MKYICNKFINRQIKKCFQFRCRHAVVIMQTLNWTIVNIIGGFGRRANFKGTRDFCLNILCSTPRDLLWCTND